VRQTSIVSRSNACFSAGSLRVSARCVVTTLSLRQATSLSG
jgi:hypothetical protein